MEAVLRQDPSGVLRPHDLRDPRPLPPRGRAHRQAHRSPRGGCRAIAVELRAAGRRRSARRLARRLLPGRSTGCAELEHAVGYRSGLRECIASLGAAPSEPGLRRRDRAGHRRRRWRRVLLARPARPRAGVARRSAARAASRRTTSRSTWSTSWSPRSCRPAVLPKLDFTRAAAFPRSIAPPSSSPRCSGASTRCARRSRTSRCSSSPTARRISTSRC